MSTMLPSRINSAEERLIREFADANPRKNEIVFKLLDEIERLRNAIVDCNHPQIDTSVCECGDKTEWCRICGAIRMQAEGCDPDEWSLPKR